DSKVARRKQKGVRPFAFYLCQCARHLVGTSSLSKMKLQAEQPLSGSKFSVSWLDYLAGKYGREVGPQNAHAVDVRLHLTKQLKELAPYLCSGIPGEASHVLARPCKALSPASFNGVATSENYNWNGGCRAMRCERMR